LQVNFVQKLEPQTGSADPAILFSLGFPKVQQAGLIIFNASILRRCVACDARGGGARGTFYTSHNFPLCVYNTQIYTRTYGERTA
jgi:hypothetical protein